MAWSLVSRLWSQSQVPKNKKSAKTKTKTKTKQLAAAPALRIGGCGWWGLQLQPQLEVETS
jgi:hypothetical protein